jgi:hypothetical protein
MTTETQLALDQVFGVIEPLTRFSRDSLLLESQNVRVTKGQAHWTFSIDVSNEKESATGRLASRNRFRPTSTTRCIRTDRWSSDYCPAVARTAVNGEASEAERSSSSEARPLTAAAAEATARVRKSAGAKPARLCLIMRSGLAQKCWRAGERS